MNSLQRLVRHARLTSNHFIRKPSPPFLVFFINSICNMKCEHCFYWTSLNQKNDLSKEEIFALSDSLGTIENLNLSGGEPFLRADFAEICVKFIEQNHVRQIYVPTYRGNPRRQTANRQVPLIAKRPEFRRARTRPVVVTDRDH